MTASEDRNRSAIQSVCRLLDQDPSRAWTLDGITAETEMPKSTLLTSFRKCMGKTPMEYLREVRMNLASELLRDGRVSIASVAQQVGYESVSAFGASFKRWAGCSPSVYRRDELKVSRLRFPDRFSK